MENETMQKKRGFPSGSRFNIVLILEIVMAIIENKALECNDYRGGI
jgi:hypothetical protein